MTIRQATESDVPDIGNLTQAAFGGDYEVGLIQKLRFAGLAVLFLVAIEAGSIVGHILFSELAVEVDGTEERSAAPTPAGTKKKALPLN